MKKPAQQLHTSREAGFTIVEVLVSLIIFSIAVVGVITVAAQGTLNVDDSKLSLTASYLADEGIELMRAMRDTSVIAGGGVGTVGWSNFTSVFGSSDCTTAAPCDIDPTIDSAPFPGTANVAVCPGGGLCPLYYLSDGSYSDIDPGSGALPSPYSRELTVVPVLGSGGNEVTVTVTVHYQEGVSVKTITESEDLFNWY